MTQPMWSADLQVRIMNHERPGGPRSATTGRPFVRFADACPAWLGEEMI